MSNVLIPSPQVQPVSVFEETEYIDIANPPFVNQQPTGSLSVPIWLPERRIYFYLEAQLSVAGAFSLFMGLKLLHQGQLVGILPCKLADFTALTPNQSVSRLFNSGGSPVGDSAVLTLAQPFTSTITTVTVQPLRVNATIDKIVPQVMGVSKGVMTGWRYWLGVLSTAY